jgi:NADPH2:quinone reductase
MYNAFTLIKNGRAKEAFELQQYQSLPLNKDEVRIKVEAFGLNYADVMARNGLYRECPPLPTVLGYEVAGVITEVKNKQSVPLIGKKVVAFTRFGGYSEEVITQENAIAILDDYPPEKALALATQYVTAYYMSQYITQVRKGEVALVHAAAGGVGTALIQLLLKQGVDVIAKVSTEEKCKYVSSLGVKHCVNYTVTDYEAKIKDILGDKKLSISFNPSGGSTFKKDLRLLGAHGRLIIFGGAERSGKKWGIFSTLNFVRKMGIIIPVTLMMTSRSILGVNMLKIADQEPQILQDCLNEVLELAKQGIINPTVNEVFSSDELPYAHERLETGKSIGKIIVKWM